MSTDNTTKSKPVTMLTSLRDQAAKFPVHLELQRLDGEMVRVTITCKAHGKRAWSRLRSQHVDAILAAEKAMAEAEQANLAPGADASAAKPSAPRLEDLVDRGITRDAEFFAGIVDSWTLPEPCDAEGLENLEDNFGGALSQLLVAYERAVYHGQLGNSGPSRAR